MLTSGGVMATGRMKCKAGLHQLTRDNRYEHPQKGTECRECKRAYMREYMRSVRARQKQSV